METKIGKHKIATDATIVMPEYHANARLREDGIHIPLSGRLDAVISLETLKEAINMIEEKDRKEEQNKKLVSGGLTITFEGVIDCNTEVKLEHLNEDEVTGIKKFIDALVNVRCSYVHTYKLTTERNLLDTDISEENAEPNEPV